MASNVLTITVKVEDVIPEIIEVIAALRDTVQRLQIIEATGKPKMLDTAALTRGEKALESLKGVISVSK